MEENNNCLFVATQSHQIAAQQNGSGHFSFFDKKNVICIKNKRIVLVFSCKIEKRKKNNTLATMAPGALAILAPFLGRKSKKYEKLQTEDPEKKRQEATEEEINRLNTKIVRLLSKNFKTLSIGHFKRCRT